MIYQSKIEPYELEFIKPAKTSRNTFEKREIFIIHLKDLKTGRLGLGEAAPLSKLSIDDIPEYKDILQLKLDQFSEKGDIQELDLNAYPSIQFGLETALADLNFKEPFKLFDTPFSRGEQKLPINGLVWMADLEDMHREALQKIEQGYTCIKFKVGAHDFDAECRLLESIRKHYSAFKLEIRLDANGAFHPDEAELQLKELKRFEIHSIEQPIIARQWDHMAKLCRSNLIDIALDEELIGWPVIEQGSEMLNYIKPQYIILKPNLIGGFSMADAWIKLAAKENIAWWATSALEGNIGLNGIAQWCSQYPVKIPQGLGTGSLYKRNINVSLTLKNGFMQRIQSAESPL